MKRAFSLTVWVLTLAKTAAAVTSTSTWTGGDRSYTNVANWSPAVVPNNLNGSGTSYVARIDGDNARAVSVRLDPFLNVAFEQLIVTTGDGLTIANGSSLYVLAGASVTGPLALTGGNDATSVYFLGAQSLAGSGQILMGGNAPNANFIHADNGGILTVAPGITIHGTGGILGNSAGLLLNQGTIT